MGNINFINYEALADVKSVFNAEAETIADVAKTLDTQAKNLDAAWSNETSKAFAARIQSEHIANLKKANAALLEVVNYIEKYALARRDEDTSGASAISG